MLGRPIRTSLGSESYGFVLVCTGPKTVYRYNVQLMQNNVNMTLHWNFPGADAFCLLHVHFSFVFHSNF